MRWEELRSNKNTERRRGGGKGVAMGGGLGAIIMAVIALFVFKKDPAEVLQNLTQGQGQTQSGSARPQTERKKEIDNFVGKILGSTEDVWTQLLPECGLEYRAPKLINYDGSTPLRSGGRVQPETFSHGTSEQRLRWFIKGIRSGELRQGDTFKVNYRDL